MKLDISKKLSPIKKVIGTNLLSILFLAGIIFFLIMPGMNKIKSIKEDTRIQRINLEKKYQGGLDLKRIANNLKKIEPSLSKINKVFINKNRDLEFITTLEEVAAKTSIAQKIELGSEDVGSGNFTKIPLRLLTEGTFAEQINYLLNLETLNYYININSVELISDPMPGNPNIRMFILADTYWK